MKLIVNYGQILGPQKIGSLCGRTSFRPGLVKTAPFQSGGDWRCRLNSGEASPENDLGQTSTIKILHGQSETPRLAAQ